MEEMLLPAELVVLDDADAMLLVAETLWDEDHNGSDRPSYMMPTGTRRVESVRARCSRRPDYQDPGTFCPAIRRREDCFPAELVVDEADAMLAVAKTPLSDATCPHGDGVRLWPQRTRGLDYQDPTACWAI